MNLWEDTHRRCHPNTFESEVPQPSTPDGWPSASQLTADSRAIDLEGVRAGINENDVILDATGGDDQPGEIVQERDYGEENRGEARRAVEHSGIDAIAYYAPIHFYGGTRWGIYLHERLFFGACAELAASLGAAHWDGIVTDMLTVLDQHELFHGAVELFGLVVEDFASFGAPCGVCPYEGYFREEYQKTWPTADCGEERIASALQFRCRFKTPRFRAALSDLFVAAPPAYASWQAYRTRDALAEAVQELARKILETINAGALVCSLLRGGGAFWFPEAVPSWLDSKGPVPRWVYRTAGITTRRFLRALLGNVRMQEFLNAVVRVYNARVVSGGKHRALVFPNGRKVPFATHRTVPDYLLGDIARALGMTRKEVLASCLEVSV